MFLSWTFFYNIELNLLPWNSFISNRQSQLGYPRASSELYHWWLSLLCFVPWMQQWPPISYLTFWKHNFKRANSTAHWINGWVNNGEAGYLRRHRAHYDVTVMYELYSICGSLSVSKPYQTVLYLLSICRHGIRFPVSVVQLYGLRRFWAPSQYKDRLIYVWRFPC